MISTELYPGLRYDCNSGTFWRLSLQGSNAVLDRRVMPDENQMLVYRCCYSKKAIKRKAQIVAWEFLNGPLQEGYRILHRNLDQSDYRGFNLCAVTQDEMRRFKDCVYNASSIRVIPSQKDVYSCLIVYKRNGAFHRKLVHDIVTAQRFKRKMQYFALKYLNKYLESK